MHQGKAALNIRQQALPEAQVSPHITTRERESVFSFPFSRERERESDENMEGKENSLSLPLTLDSIGRGRFLLFFFLDRTEGRKTLKVTGTPSDRESKENFSFLSPLSFFLTCCASVFEEKRAR